jgi:hypothetical protein
MRSLGIVGRQLRARPAQKTYSGRMRLGKSRDGFVRAVIGGPGAGEVGGSMPPSGIAARDRTPDPRDPA